MAFAQRKKETFDSIYEVEKPKVEKFSLKADASTLGFATFLKKDQLGLNLSYQQQSDVYQNTLIVQLTQLLMIFCVFQYERQNFEHLITPSDSLDMMIARFIASIMMHINVEQDVKQGISMMKYATNHWREFNNPLMPFITGLLSTLIALIIEFNVMIILSALPDLLGIIVRYVSLASIAKVPGIYFGSLANMQICDKLRGKKL